ncbi:MAG TPA: GNAT family N-acetyltransferase [Acidimicrobiales bacterium]|nr:GNAT family N-acetyltransferase [Acidimicrobiales bacterium]
MRGRRRLGVALLLDPPASVEVEGLRRALGDTSLGHVAPHLTLVPPVNVRAAELEDALRLVRRAAATQDGPLWVELGPVETFVPVTPVVYLGVGGPDLGRLGRLKSTVLSGPLLRAERWPWVPHVTLADEAPPEQAAAALQALAHYRSRISFDRVVVLEERGRHWHPLADTCFGPPRVVGRGGLELEITEGRLVGPDVLAMAEAQLGGAAQPGGAQLGESIVLTGRREGRVAGFAAAWHGGQAGEPVNIGVLVEAECRRQGVGRALVTVLELTIRRRGWALEGVRGYGPEGFFRNTGGWVHSFRPGGL